MVPSWVRCRLAAGPPGGEARVGCVDGPRGDADRSRTGDHQRHPAGRRVCAAGHRAQPDLRRHARHQRGARRPDDARRVHYLLLFTLWGVSPLISLLVAMGLMFAFGALLQRVVVERVVGQPLLVSLLLTFGLSSFLTGSALNLWRSEEHT